MNMSPTNKAHFKSKKEAIDRILTGIGDEIYSTVNACQIAQEMLEAIERLQQGESLNIQDRTMNVAKARENVGSPVVQQSRIQCFNCKELGHFAKECRKPKRVKDSVYHKEKMLLCKQAEKGVPLQAEQYDWLADTDEEIDEQELEAHYSYMAKIQEVPTADTSIDSESLEHEQNDTGYNVFANKLQHSEQSESISNTCLVEMDDSNIILDSPDICDDAIQNNRNNVETDDNEFEKYKAFNDRTIDYDKLKLVKEKHDELIKQSLLTKLHYEGLVKQKTKVITDLKLKEEHDIDKMLSLEEQLKFLNEIVYRWSQSIQTIHMMAPKVPTYNGRPTFANPRYLKQAQSEIPCLYALPYDQSTHANRLILDGEETLALKRESRSKLNKDSTCLMPLALKTQNDSFIFVHEFKQEMHADLKYGESLEKEIDELEYDKAKFSNMYDMILQECMSNEFMCCYLLSLSDLDALAELQCLYLYKVKECDCLAQKLSKQIEFISKEVHTELLQRFAKIEKHSISFEIALQKYKEHVKNDTVWNEQASNVFRKEREQYIKIQDLKAQLQDKNIAISELKKLIEKCKGKYVETKFDKPSVVRQQNAQRIPKPSVLGKPAPFLDSLERRYFQRPSRFPKLTCQKVYQNQSLHRLYLKQQDKLTSTVNAVCATCGKRLVDSNHFACVTKMLNDVNTRNNKPNVVPLSTRKPKGHANKSVATPHKKKVASKSTTQKPKSYYRMLYEKTSKAWKWWIEQQCPSEYKWVPKTKMQWVPKARNENVQKRIVQLIIFIVDSGCTKHMTGNLKLLCNFVEKYLGTVCFGNDQFAPIIGYGDLVPGNIMINRVYYVKGRNHNLFSVGQFCDADLEVAFQKSTCRFNFRRTSLTGFPAQSIRSSNAIALESPYLLVLITGTSQSRKTRVTKILQDDQAPEEINCAYQEYPDSFHPRNRSEGFFEINSFILAVVRVLLSLVPEGDPYSIEILEGMVDKTYACSMDPHFTKMMIQQHLWMDLKMS
nr:integrase, catalytic region, zinc finger, CCHC-type, peptidase aspartic, catalytic [Tanacetum cinerariifolium]